MAARSIDFEKPFTYVFKDPTWVKKVLLGGVFAILSVVLVGAFVVMGYQKKLFKALLENENAPLPEFEFGKDLAEGLPIVGIVLCYTVPGILLSAIPCIGQLLGPLWSMALMVALPAVLTRYYVTGQFKSVFEFSELIAYVKANFVNLLLVAVIGLLTSFASSVGLIACIVGAFFVAFWGGLVQTRATADVYRLSLDAQGGALAPPPAAPPAP